MRIAYFVIDFPSLAQTFVLNQITGLLERGHDVHVFARWSGRSLHHPDVARYGLLERTSYWPRMPDDRWRRWAKAAGLFLARGRLAPAIVAQAARAAHYGRLNMLRELTYGSIPVQRAAPCDVTHCQFDHVGIHAVALRELGLIRGKIVTTFHDYGVTRFVRLRGRHVFEHLFAAGDLFLAISEHTRRHLVRLGCPPEKIRIHHAGVDCGRFVAGSRERRRGAPLQLASVGRLVEKKGFEFGVRAVAELRRRGASCEYRIAGEGPQQPYLEALIRELGVDDCVRLLGPRPADQVATLLQETDIFLAPSVTAPDGDEEGVPVALMEAMASGLPVVSTQHAGIPELVQEGVSGYLVPERDVPALADGVAVLGADEARRARMGQSGRRFVEEHFNIDRLNDRLARLLENVALNKDL